MGVLRVGTGRGVAEVLFVASASPRRSRVAYLVAALASSRACWRVVRAGRSSDRGGETHHMRTPRATQMARSSISEQPGRSSPMCWPVRCSLATADASRKRRRSTAAALKCQGAASGGTEHWWRSFVPREGSRFDCRTPRALSLRVGGTQRRRDTAWPWRVGRRVRVQFLQSTLSAARPATSPAARQWSDLA